MTEYKSDIFKNVDAAAKANAQKQSEQKKSDDELLCSLFEQLINMKHDFEKHSVWFEWGHNRYDRNDKCILISYPYTENIKRIHCIIASYGKIYCVGEREYFDSPDNRDVKESIGGTAQEAALNIVRGIISTGYLLPRFDKKFTEEVNLLGNRISDSGARKLEDDKRNQEVKRSIFWAMCCIMFVMFCAALAAQYIYDPTDFFGYFFIIIFAILIASGILSGFSD